MVFLIHWAFFASQVTPDSTAGRSARLTSPPPIEDHLIQLLAHWFHVRISEVGVDGDDVVRVRAGLVQRVEQAIIEVGLAHRAGRALGASLPRGMPNRERTLLPSKLTSTMAC